MVHLMNQITRNAIQLAGGAGVVSRACKLTRQAVAKWDEVPPKHVLTIERLSGITRYELRPDIYGAKPGPLGRRPASRSSAHV